MKESQASFQTLRETLAEYKEEAVKNNWVQVCALAKKVWQIKTEMVAQADESVRYSVERHIDAIINSY